MPDVVITDTPFQFLINYKTQGNCSTHKISLLKNVLGMAKDHWSCMWHWSVFLSPYAVFHTPYSIFHTLYYVLYTSYYLLHIPYFTRCTPYSKSHMLIGCGIWRKSVELLLFPGFTSGQPKSSKMIDECDWQASSDMRMEDWHVWNRTVYS